MGCRRQNISFITAFVTAWLAGTIAKGHVKELNGNPQQGERKQRNWEDTPTNCYKDRSKTKLHPALPLAKLFARLAQHIGC